MRVYTSDFEKKCYELYRKYGEKRQAVHDALRWFLEKNYQYDKRKDNCSMCICCAVDRILFEDYFEKWDEFVKENEK